MEFCQDPNQIEEKSMKIIESLIGESTEGLPELQRKIIKRVIHTTADPDCLGMLNFSSDSLANFEEAIKKERPIITDTNMVLAGINKKKLTELNLKAFTLIAEKETAALAAEKEITRSMAAVELAAQNHPEAIFVFGNAPTGLFQLLELFKKEQLNPAGVIGVPVGFVGAAASKKELLAARLPSITLQGLKGGSNIAAAIINAFLYHFAS